MATAVKHTTARRTNTRGNSNRSTTARGNAGRESYVYGNTARALRPVSDVQSPRKVKNKSRKNIDKDTSMNPAFMLFLTAAMVVTGFVCIRYIELQSTVTSYVDKISAMEIQLDSLRAENDDYESRIKGAVGLENIKKRAMDDLGMSYAKDEQIVVYESDGTDYVRQFVSIE